MTTRMATIDGFSIGWKPDLLMLCFSLKLLLPVLFGLLVQRQSEAHPQRLSKQHLQSSSLRTLCPLLRG